MVTKVLTQDKADQLQENCIERIKDKSVYQKVLVFEYALLLVQDTPRLFDWIRINQVILERYKKSGLKRIKESAWKVHEQWLRVEQKQFREWCHLRKDRLEIKKW